MRTVLSLLILAACATGAFADDTQKPTNPWKPLFQDLETLREMVPAERAQYLQKRFDQFVDVWVTTLPAEQRAEVEIMVAQIRQIRSLPPEQREAFLSRLGKEQQETLQAFARDRSAEFEKILSQYREETARLARVELDKFLSYLPEDSRKSFAETLRTLDKLQTLTPEERQTYLAKESRRLRHLILNRVDTFMDRFDLGKWNEVEPRPGSKSRENGVNPLPREFLPRSDPEEAPTEPKTDTKPDFEQK